MSEKVNVGQRSKYVQFRFQDSLRKYQQPPRKKVKLSQPNLSKLEKNTYKTDIDNRLARLCETRKIYNATSREKASEYSRRKQAMEQSFKKGPDQVSDFNCSENPASHSAEQKENADQFQHKFPIFFKIFSLNHNCNQNENEMKKEELLLQQTPMPSKQTPLLERNQQPNSVEKSIQPQSKELIQRNEIKVKDIDFHIRLVEQLHQKIISVQNEEYAINDAFRIQQQENKVSKFDENGLKNQHHQQYHIEMSFKPPIEKHNEQEKKEILNQSLKQSQDEQQSNMHYTVNQKANATCQGMEIELSSYDKPGQSYTENVREILSTFFSEKMEAQFHEGRIRFKGSKGECYLSARVLNKFLMLEKSPRNIVRRIMKHHPQLDNVSQFVQMLIEKRSMS